MSRGRDAIDTITGYYYQFDYYILQLLNLSKDTDTVTIEGIYGAGTCVYDGAKVLSTKDDTSDDYVWTTSGSTVSYTQSFDQAIDKADVEGDKTIKLDGDKEQFTFMLIPQTIPSTAKVKVVMWDSENNVEHTFAGTISDGTAKWLPGKTYTYIISRNAVVWEYIFFDGCHFDTI